jgi:hypothetical protein
MISSPDLAASRSRVADWIELKALFSNSAGEANIANLARLASDDQRQREIDEHGELVESEIVDNDIQQLSERVTEEIGFRANTLGDEYPFVIHNRPFRIDLKKVDDLTPAQWTYLFLLLMSGEKDKRLPSSEKIAGLVRTGRTLFHICASIGVAGLLRNGHTVWFGAPREDHTKFLEAIANLCTRLKCGKAKGQIPAGLPQDPKDDKIDVVGWRSFGDFRNGNLLVLCQAATGKDWDDKSIVNHVHAFKAWFDVAPYAMATVSIALPFPAHHEVEEHPDVGFEVATHTALDRTHHRHGVILDRLRIVESVLDVGSDEASKGSVDGLDKLPELKRWVSAALAAIREAA